MNLYLKLACLISIAVAQKPGNKLGKNTCRNSAPDGYKQVNAVVSQATNEIILDGTLYRLCMYNYGRPSEANLTETCAIGLPDASKCPVTWDSSETPVGILSEAIACGTFKWCIHETDFGSIDDGLIDVATADNELEGIKAGDYYGGGLDSLTAITIRMGKILRANLKMELVNVTNVEGSFPDIVNAMAANKCYASLPFYFQHPYREQVADFVCPFNLITNNEFAVFALKGGADLDLALQNGGQGLKMCGAASSTQDSLTARTFPNATIVDTGNPGNFLPGLCNGTCDAMVNGLSGINSALPDSPCGADVVYKEIAPPSSAGSSGAFTYRAI